MRMKTTLIDEISMRDLGFTDHVERNWYYCSRVGDMTTLNVTISKETGEYTTDVLNEYFLQPEPYYSRMKEKYKNEIINNIDAILEQFKISGLIIQHDHTQW